MNTLSLSVIVKNEEANLERLLLSVCGLCEQIAIVDTGSTDRTVEIAKNFGAEVHYFGWVDDFAAARNFAFSKCTKQYILWLDADDEILSEDREKILLLKPNLHLADAWLAKYNYAQDEFGNSIVSLFRHRFVKNSGELKWRWPIHECMVIPSHWKQITTPIVVTHRRSGDDYVKDLGRNIRILKKAVDENPDEQRILYYYAKELFSDGKTIECLPIFEKYFAAGGGWHDDELNAHYMMAVAYMNMGDEIKAINKCMDGIKQDPRLAEFYVLIGQIHYNNARWNKAIYWFELASRLPFPDMFGTILNDNYTWVPHDRLCKAYSEVGRLLDAYNSNEIALRYRPSDTRMLYNREFLRDLLFPSRKAERPIRISLGSGGKPTSGYICTDKFQAPNVVELIDQTSTPYHQATVHAIYSEHALEHSDGHDAAEKTVEEWARILRHGGHLWLKVPDLDLCCNNFLQSEDRDRLPTERWTHKEWFKYTIYGIQRSQNGEPDIAQYHRTGFTKPSLTRLLEKHGFEIESISNYDGWGTPSIEVKAIQTRQKLKIAWMIPGHLNQDHGSLRIRRLNINRWLMQNDISSEIIDYTIPEELNKARSADVCVFISFGSVELNIINSLKRSGVKCVMDHCENIFGLPFQKECFEAVDLITCCSTVLAERTQSLGRVTMIPDACEEQTWTS